MTKHLNDRHTRTGRAISFALTIGTSLAWEGVAIVFLARLTRAERAALAYAALTSLDEATAYRTASVVLFGVMDGEVLA